MIYMQSVFVKTVFFKLFGKCFLKFECEVAMIFLKNNHGMLLFPTNIKYMR